ncbi:glucosamine 6-phosphate N-acetyltransferase SCDLUD_000690 [Saccharomycodes ludwigii]|uniref:glucosamine 6-phosphate N-acetyltransferase n=1 Tax=Saccharomycodes ludwigii TaxID=36035 RepID=UPI001E86C951|nr:hypothetical protein SCDLUD_000690 [Saccharomycodes ludwigii]KAH3903079.1 hypothetical protein SCDLUD_000690 [Saccharomycodes ludwigii]
MTTTSETKKLNTDIYEIRRIKASDYEDVTKTLTVLTTVGVVTKEKFHKLLNYWDSVKLPDRPDERMFNPLVIVNKKTGKVVATGMLLIEPKIIHECGFVGHIEDIAVASSEQGKNLGYHLIRSLVETGKRSGCYKIILDCDAKNIGFYEKSDFSKAGIEMQIRF